MIHVMYYDPDTGKQQTGGEELISTWASSENGYIWADFHDEQVQHEARILEETFCIHPLSIQDAQRKRHPPKIQKLENCTFIILKGLSPEIQETQFETIQLTFFIGERFLVTRHTKTSLSINETWDQSLQDIKIAVTDTGNLAIRITKKIIERFMPILLDLETQFEEIEDDMISDPNDVLLHKLVSYKSDLKKLRRVMAYHNRVVERIKSSDWPGFSASDENELHHLHEKLERVYSLSTFYYEQATDLQDGYISLATHHLNSVVRTLTIITVIFIPLSFIAGVYGMNFANMPELQYKYAYYIVLGVMMVIAVCLVVFFKRKKWL